MFSCLVALAFQPCALNPLHQCHKSRILADLGPVRIRLKPWIVLVSQIDCLFQPAESLFQAALKQMSRSQPVSDIMIGRSDAFGFFRQLVVRLAMAALSTKENGQDRPNTIHLWMMLQHLLEYSRGCRNLAAVVKHERAE